MSLWRWLRSTGAPTKIVRPVIGITDLTAPNAHTPLQPGEVDMIEQLAFALVAVALAAPFLVPLLWLADSVKLTGCKFGNYN